MHLKGTLLLFLTFLLSGLLSAPVHAECEGISVSAHPNYPPFHWEENGRLVGASIEITGQILNELSIPWNASPEGPWKRVLKKAENGEVNLIPALKATPDRASFLTFTSTPFSQNPVAIFIRAEDKEKIRSIDDLASLIGSINLGDKHGEEVDTFIASHPAVSSIKGIAQNFEILRRKRTDFFIEGKFTGLAYLVPLGMQDEFKIIHTFEEQWVHIGFSINSGCNKWTKAFDEKLQEYVAKGVIDETVERYTNMWLNSNALTQQ